jgi:hypothetical protein
MSADLRVAGALLVALAFAGCTAVLDEGEFVVAGADAGADSSAGGSSSGSSASEAGDGGSSGGGPCSIGQSQCAGSTPQRCVDGHWENAGGPCGGEDPACVAGACKPCAPGARECQGLQANECTAIGEWTAADLCPYLCDAGVCSGACVPGTTQCNGTAVESCTASGAWQFSTQCTYACIDGACAGDCVPATVQCTPSGTGVQLCDSMGAWQTTMCADACDQGQCITGCVPNTTRCADSMTVQVCDTTGAWQNQTCSQPTPDCEGGACECLAPATSCPSACTDTSSDSANCGGCGNDCKGQPCSGGVCQPMALATGQDQPWGIALGGGSCYWTDRGNGTVMTVGAAGTRTDAGVTVTPSMVASSQNSPTSIATDATNAYWVDTTNGGSVLECALGGCMTPTALASSQPSPWGIAIPSAGGVAYFTAGSSAWSVSIGDGGVSPLGSESGTPYPIATDGSFVYWSDDSGAVYKCAAGGCTTPTQLSGPAGQPSSGIAVDASNVYFTLGGGSTPGAVWMVSKAGTNAVSMTAANTPLGIAVDPSTGFVYWTDAGDGTVMKMSTGDAGGPITIASAQSNPTGIVLDSTYVYWTNAVATTGSVMRMTK